MRAQSAGSPHVMNDLLGLESVQLLGAVIDFGGAEPNANVWPDQSCAFFVSSRG